MLYVCDVACARCVCVCVAAVAAVLCYVRWVGCVCEVVVAGMGRGK